MKHTEIYAGIRKGTFDRNTLLNLIEKETKIPFLLIKLGFYHSTLPPASVDLNSNDLLPRKHPDVEWLHLLALIRHEEKVAFLESVHTYFPFLLGDIIAVLWSCQFYPDARPWFYLEAVHTYDPEFQTLSCAKTAYSLSLVESPDQFSQLFSLLHAKYKK